MVDIRAKRADVIRFYGMKSKWSVCLLNEYTVLLVRLPFQNCVILANMKTIVSKTGAIRIPAELRKKYNLTAGSKVVIVDYGGVLSIVPAVKDPIKTGRGFLKEGPSLYDSLKKDRELEKKREKRFMNG